MYFKLHCQFLFFRFIDCDRIFITFQLLCVMVFPKCQDLLESCQVLISELQGIICFFCVTFICLLVIQLLSLKMHIISCLYTHLYLKIAISKTDILISRKLLLRLVQSEKTFISTTKDELLA